MGSTVPEVEGDVSASARPKQTVGKVTIHQTPPNRSGSSTDASSYEHRPSQRDRTSVRLQTVSSTR